MLSPSQKDSYDTVSMVANVNLKNNVSTVGNLTEDAVKKYIHRKSRREECNEADF